MPETVKRCIGCGRVIPEDELICLQCGSENDMQMFRTKVRTNGDRIRSMTNDQIAEFLRNADYCAVTRGDFATLEECSGRKCSECVTEWLEKEAESDD